jgi:tetratricopeptide (TPR) repeat protein
MPPEAAKGVDLVPPPKAEIPAQEAPPIAPPTAAPAAAPAPAAVVPPSAALPSAPARAVTAAPKGSAPESNVSNVVPAGKGINFYLGQGHHLLDSKPELALKYFAKAGEVDPRSPEPDSGRGLAYSNMERWSDAVAAFQLSLKKSPEYTEALIGLAEAYRAQGTAANKRRALGLYRRYLDLAPNGPDAPVAKAQVEILESDLKAEATPAAAPAETAAPEAPAAQAPAEAAPPLSEPPAAPPPVLAPDNPPKPAGQ